jgi:MFS transporter, BCD family, chlorophyll transporter
MNAGSLQHLAFGLTRRLAPNWRALAPRYLPFADAATADLPLGRLLRLSLFQVSVGLALALLVGTLNRVMIVELGVSAWLVALMVALPVLIAPFRTLVGFRSDTHRSALGWRRVPYIWMGSMLQFGGLAIMPFALLLLTGQGEAAPPWLGHVGAALAFLMVGAGVQTTQTAGLALATDLASEATRPRVVALMYVMLLLGMVGAGFAYGALLADFSETRLVQVIQGAAVLTLALNLIALWKQEPRDPSRNRDRTADSPGFRQTWRAFVAQPKAVRFLTTVALGTAAFNMQDIVLEPYGGEILKLSVGATSALTALAAAGSLAAFALAARMLSNGGDAHRVAAYGALVGLLAFVAVIFSAPLESAALFRTGTVLIGFGGGLFAVGTLSAAMGMERPEHVGLALGAWGAMQATAAGVSVALGGALRDVVSHLATSGVLGEALSGAVTGYGAVWHLEIVLLFATLIAIGPLTRPIDQFRQSAATRAAPKSFGLADLPG